MAGNDLFDSPPTVRRSAGSPAHAQIEQWLMDSITKGRLRPGQRLPPERDFAVDLGVSRMTLRQALDGLERRGVLVRTPGRFGGAFVAEPKVDCDLTGLAGFTEQMRRAHLKAGARVISAETVAAAANVAEHLEIRRGDRVHEIVRVRSANRVPLALERSFLPVTLFPDLLEHRLTGSLYKLIGRHYGRGPHTAVEFLEPVTATADEAAALGTEEGAALMLVERTAHSVAGQPVEYARDVYRADRVRLMIRTGVGTDVEPALRGVARVDTGAEQRPRR